jgi:hypothetical protein
LAEGLLERGGRHLVDREAEDVAMGPESIERNPSASDVLSGRAIRDRDVS